MAKKSVDRLVQEWADAVYAYEKFEKEHPYNLSNEWERLLYAKEAAETALKEYAKTIPRGQTKKAKG